MTFPISNDDLSSPDTKSWACFGCLRGVSSSLSVIHLAYMITQVHDCAKDIIGSYSSSGIEGYFQQSRQQFEKNGVFLAAAAVTINEGSVALRRAYQPSLEQSFSSQKGTLTNSKFIKLQLRRKADKSSSFTGK